MCLLRVRGNATCVVVRNMSVVMHHQTCVRDVGTKGINTNTEHNNYFRVAVVYSPQICEQYVVFLPQILASPNNYL